MRIERQRPPNLCVAPTMVSLVDVTLNGYRVCVGLLVLVVVLLWRRQRRAFSLPAPRITGLRLAVASSDGDGDVDAIQALEAAEHVPYVHERVSAVESEARSVAFLRYMRARRSLRFFSPEPVPRNVIDNIIAVAGSAPSGANQQPWTFCVVESAEVKARIREVVEAEELVNYERRMGDKWVQDLQHLGTNHEKPYLEHASHLIVVLKQNHGVTSSGAKQPHYYAAESTLLASGFLVTAVHMAGLVTLTSTPLNAGKAIKAILGRPNHEKVLLLLPVGYAAHDATVPHIAKKPLESIREYY